MTLDLLGVPVGIVWDDPLATPRLEAAYGGCSRSPSPPEVEARALRGGDGYEIVVTGREGARHHGLTESLRALHHEVLHAVMGRRPDLFFIHAAVLEHEQDAIVLPGVSGAGKSTLALALAASGARFLSDEVLAFDPEGLRLLAFPRAPKIRDVCVAAFPEFLSDFVGEGEGRFLPLSRIPRGPDAFFPRSILVLLPRWSPDAPREPVPLGPGEALLRLADSSLNFGARREGSVDCLARLIGAASTFEFGWRCPREGAAAILGLLHEARPA